MKKAQQLSEVAQALDKFSPIPPDHEFYVNFSGLRGDFKDRRLFRMLNINRDGEGNWKRHEIRSNILIFLAGMRGSGKTTELLRYAQILEEPNLFFCVICNIDKDLSLSDMEYMDILILQLEKLIEKINTLDIKLKIDDEIVEQMQKWFDEQIETINKMLKIEGGIEINTQNKSNISLWSLLLGSALAIRSSLSGSYEKANTVRKITRNNFMDFAKLFNRFVEETSRKLREKGVAQDILFIVDGLEKTMTADVRRKIIIDGSNQIREIRANTIFTLPIELMKEVATIKHFAELLTFPFIKITKANGEENEQAIEKFKEFIEKRMDTSLFESEQVIKKAIQYSGGSPRQLLRILEEAVWETDDDAQYISEKALDRAILRLGNEIAKFLSPEEYEELRKIDRQIQKKQTIEFSPLVQELLEKDVLFEYNDGSYKRINPLVEASPFFKHHVLGEE